MLVFRGRMSSGNTSPLDQLQLLMDANHWIHTTLAVFHPKDGGVLKRLPFWGLRSSTSDIGTDGIYILGGDFNYFLCSPLFGEDSHFGYIIFFRWVETTNQWRNLHFITCYCYAYFCSVFVGEMNQCTKAHFWCVWGSGKSENNVMVRKTIFSLPAKQNFLGHRSIGLVSRHGELWRVFFWMIWHILPTCTMKIKHKNVGK